jgi:hypothetical protein
MKQNFKVQTIVEVSRKVIIALFLMLHIFILKKINLQKLKRKEETSEVVDAIMPFQSFCFDYTTSRRHLKGISIYAKVSSYILNR